MLHPIFQEDELTLIIAGGVLGAIAGGVQAWLSRRSERKAAELAAAAAASASQAGRSGASEGAPGLPLLGDEEEQWW